MYHPYLHLSTILKRISKKNIDRIYYKDQSHREAITNAFQEKAGQPYTSMPGAVGHEANGQLSRFAPHH